MMSRHKRQSRGDRIFRKWVLPILKNHYGGIWQSTSGTHLDYTYCIDWFFTCPEGIPYQVASRSWQSKPKQHFSVRYRKTSDPAQKVETQIMLDNLHQGKSFPDKTIEAFIYNGWVYIAVVDSKMLWKVIQQMIDSKEILSIFRLKEAVGHTEFIRVPFKRLPRAPQKIVARAIGF